MGILSITSYSSRCQNATSMICFAHKIEQREKALSCKYQYIERNIGKRRVTTTPTTPGATRSTKAVLCMAIRPGSARTVRATTTPCYANTTRQLSAATTPHKCPAGFRRITTNIPATPTTGTGYGNLTWIWPGHGIPVR